YRAIGRLVAGDNVGCSDLPRLVGDCPGRGSAFEILRRDHEFGPGAKRPPVVISLRRYAPMIAVGNHRSGRGAVRAVTEKRLLRRRFVSGNDGSRSRSTLASGASGQPEAEALNGNKTGFAKRMREDAAFQFVMIVAVEIGAPAVGNTVENTAGVSHYAAP